MRIRMFCSASTDAWAFGGSCSRAAPMPRANHVIASVYGNGVSRGCSSTPLFQSRRSSAYRAGIAASPKYPPQGPAALLTTTFFSKVLLKDRSRLESRGVSLGFRFFRGREAQRVQDLRLMVLRIVRRDLSHRIAIGDQAGVLRRAVEVAVQLGNRRNVRLFALRLRARSFASFRAL